MHESAMCSQKCFVSRKIRGGLVDGVDLVDRMDLVDAIGAADNNLAQQQALHSVHQLRSGAPLRPFAVSPRRLPPARTSAQHELRDLHGVKRCSF